MQARKVQRTAIVTGAGQGIGRAIALRLLAAGANLVVADRNAEGVERLATEHPGRIRAFVADIADHTSMQSLTAFTLEAFGRIDILAQNAGIYPEMEIAGMTATHWARTLEVNLTGTFNACQAVLPAMREQGYGRMVFTSSITGPRVAAPGTAAYCASKGGINGFTRAAALEFAPFGITVNVVEPGNIMTEGLAQGRSGDFIDAMTRSIPVGRIGLPEDVAAAVAFLASEEAGFITGTSIVVDGGQILPEAKL